MIRSLWFFIKLTVIAAAIIWLATRQGQVSLSLMGYEVTAHAGFFLIVVFIVMSVALMLWRVLSAIAKTPRTLLTIHEQGKEREAYRALSRGWVAIALGDAKKAAQCYRQTQSLPAESQPLVALLGAQAARLRGDSQQEQKQFQILLQDKETAFLGLCGLIQTAMSEGDFATALYHAQAARDRYPKTGWVNRLVYDLYLKTENWDRALEIIEAVCKYQGIKKERMISDKIALYHIKAQQAEQSDNRSQATRWLEKALALDPAFSPTVMKLAQEAQARGKAGRAQALIKAAWRMAPHPDLAILWEQMAPPLGSQKAYAKRLKWFEDLVALHPAAVEGQIIAAKAAMDMGFWGEARAYLNRAEQIYPSAQIYRLKVMVEQNSSENDDMIQTLMEKASQALPEKVWFCRQSGLTYTQWHPLAEPHGSFNTIQWGLPRAGMMASRDDQGLINDYFPGLLPAIGKAA